MNFQEKLVDTSTELRARASAFTNAALKAVRARTSLAAKRAENLKGPLATLTGAGRELSDVARRHASRFVKENSSLALAAGKDVTSLARATYASLAAPKVVKSPRKVRKPRATSARKRAAKAA